MKNIYELTGADDDEIHNNVNELVGDLRREGWYVSQAFNRDEKESTPSWKVKASDPNRVKESFDCRSGQDNDSTVIPVLDRTKFKVMTPAEYAEYQAIFGGGN